MNKATKIFRHCERMMGVTPTLQLLFTQAAVIFILVPENGDPLIIHRSHTHKSFYIRIVNVCVRWTIAVVTLPLLPACVIVIKYNIAATVYS